MENISDVGGNPPVISSSHSVPLGSTPRLSDPDSPLLLHPSVVRPGLTPRPIDPDNPWIVRLPSTPIVRPRIPKLPPTLPPPQSIDWPPVIFRPRPTIIPGPSSPVTPVKLPIDPSLILKAYASALRPFLTLERDLSRADQAIFIANPMQYGIPSGLEKDEYLNEAIFGIANPIQNPESPAFSRGGTGFFEWLQSYVINVKDTVTAHTDLTVGEATLDDARKKTARDEYEAAAKVADEQYEKMFEAFVRAHKEDSRLELLKWISDLTGEAYRDAVKERQDKSDALKALQTTGILDVIRRRETLDSAMARAELKEGNNMPCTLRDLDADTSSTDTLPPAGIIYRPLHYLSGYDVASTRWVTEYPTITKPQKLALDLEGAANVKWKDLGFENLDPSTPIASRTPEFEVWLEFTGIASFDVFRGLWNVDGIRTILPPLLSTASPALKSPVMKTIKVLVGYDVDLVIKLPKTLMDTLPTDSEGSKVQLPPEVVSTLTDLVGHLPVTVRENGELHARSDRDNAYPALLAVLAQSV